VCYEMHILGYNIHVAQHASEYVHVLLRGTVHTQTHVDAHVAAHLRSPNRRRRGEKTLMHYVSDSESK